MKEIPPSSIAILVGGASRRMGTDKTQLRIGNHTLIEYVIDRVAPLSDDLMLCGNHLERFAHLPTPRLIQDTYTGIGALAGIHSALQAARYERTLVLACDMPLISLHLARYMIVLSSSHDAVVPHLGDQIEPLFAVYTRRCLPAIERAIQRGQRRIISFYPHVLVRYVEEEEIALLDPQHHSFLNANTPEDWQRIQTLLKETLR